MPCGWLPAWPLLLRTWQLLSRAPHMCGWSSAWVATICLRRLGFVIFQTGNPNACSYGIQIWYEIPRVESKLGLAHINLFFHMRMAAGAYGWWGSFSSASTSAGALMEQLRAGAGLENLQDQDVKMYPPLTLLGVDTGVFLGWEVADINVASIAQTHSGLRSEASWKGGDNTWKGKWQLPWCLSSGAGKCGRGGPGSGSENFQQLNVPWTPRSHSSTLTQKEQSPAGSPAQVWWRLLGFYYLFSFLWWGRTTQTQTKTNVDRCWFLILEAKYSNNF